MLRGNWRLICVCLALASSPVFGQEQPEPNPSEQRSESGGETSRPPFPIVIIQPDDEAAHEQEREAKSDAHEAADLVAQQNAAAAAERSATATEWQIGPIWASVILSAAAAILSALALGTGIWTQRTVDRTTRAELRAYVALDKIDFRLDRATYTFVATLTFKNSGVTPAYEVLTACACKTEPFPASDRWATELPDIGNSRGPIPPSATRIVNIVGGPNSPVRLAEHEVRAIFETAHIGLWIYGRIDYIDAFHRPQWNTFRLYLDTLNGPHMLTYSDDGNDESF